ncbi:MAG: carbohydrate ABC transporter permease [Clostridia bacterium]
MANNLVTSSKRLAAKVASKKLEMSYIVSKFFKVAFRTAFLLGLGFVMLYPILILVSNAFKAKEDIYDPTVIWIPKHFSFDALKLAVGTLDYWNKLISTCQILFPSVILQVVSTVLVAYGFARFKFKGKGFLFGVLIFTIIVPIQTYIVPLYGSFQSIKMLNTPIAFWIMAAFGMGIRSGLYIFIVRQFFRNMPPEIEEAALIDGCGYFKTFLKVMLPNVVPAIVTISLFSIVWYWNDYYMASMFYNSNQPLSVYMTFLQANLSVNSQTIIKDITSTDLWLLKDGVLSCGALLTIGPILLLYCFAQKFFTESIERTGIVG